MINWYHTYLTEFTLILILTLALTLNPKSPTLTLTLTLFQFNIYDVPTCFTLYTADHNLHSAFCVLQNTPALEIKFPFLCRPCTELCYILLYYRRTTRNRVRSIKPMISNIWNGTTLYHNSMTQYWISELILVIFSHYKAGLNV